MRSSVAAVMVASVALSFIAAAPQTSGPPRPSVAFTRLFDQYRGGDAGAAILAFSRWKAGRVAAEARLPPGVTDVRSLAALALLHTEAGIANGTFGDFAEGTPTFIVLGDWGLGSVFEVHALTAYRLIEDLIGRARKEHDDDLLRFCRSWYIVAMSACRRGNPTAAVGASLEPAGDSASPQAPARGGRSSGPAGNSGYSVSTGGRTDCVLGLKDKAIHYFSDDAEVLLLLGSVEEPRQMTRSQLEDMHHPLVGAPFQLAYGQKALNYFDDALKVDPALAEARVRKGHLLHIARNEPDAQPLLERALSDARAAGNAFVTHLAALFLGELHEDAGDLDAAIPFYRDAVAVMRAHTASIALGQALIRTGRATEGWTVAGRMFGREGSGSPAVVDPWVLYRYAQYWQIDDRLEVMRTGVRTR